jgi:hypothetical protein
VVPPIRMLRRSDGKKMTKFYTRDVREIYHLSEDPRELRNIQQTVPKEVKQRLQHRLNALKDCVGYGCRTAEVLRAARNDPELFASISVESTKLTC